MAKKATLKIDVFAGSALTNGAYYKYYDAMVLAVLTCSSEKLDVSQLTTDIWLTLSQMSKLINSQQAYEETAAVSLADHKRDRLFYYIYWTLYYGNELDPSSSLYAPAHKLWVKVSPYKGISAHELMKQTAEVDGVYRDVKNDTEAWAAAETLGLQAAFTQLYNANVELKDAIQKRESERGERAADQGGLTTTQLRRELWSEWQEVADRVTAAYLYTGDDAIAKAIQEVNGVVAHYRLVAANTAKSQQADGSDDLAEPTETAPTAPAE